MAVLPGRADEFGPILLSAEPMLAASSALRVVTWNEGAEALLGFTRTEVLGERCFDVLRCGFARRRRCAECGDRQGEPMPSFEHDVVTKSAERIAVSVTTLLAAAAPGAPVRVHLLRDQTRQRRLDSLLRDLVSGASSLLPEATPPDASGARASTPPRQITAREWEIVRLLARGCSTTDIAAQLEIAPRTARNHIQSVLCKLRVHSRLEAVAYASALGLL